MSQKIANIIAIIEIIRPIIPGAFESFVAIPIIDNIKATIPRIRPIRNVIGMKAKIHAIIPKISPKIPVVLPKFFHHFFISKNPIQFLKNK